MSRPVAAHPAASDLSRQCKVCGTPLGGAMSLVFRAAGIRRSPRNPNLCSRCNTHAEEGHLVEMTTLFADLSGFTEMTARLGPQRTHEVADAFLKMATQALIAHDGFIDKYVGDAVMAFWGPPFTDAATHAELCCAAAVDQLSRLEDFRKSLPDLLGVKHGLPLVNIRMGIATGEVTVGNIGSETSRGYTVIGDTVNLASRLEQANKFYGTLILVNEDTQRLAKNELAFREIDSLRVAGRMEPVRVFELMGFHKELSAEQRQLIEAFERGLAAYRKQDWDAAEAAFNEGLKYVPADAPCQVFLNRIRTFRQSPLAPDWDGVWVATHK